MSSRLKEGPRIHDSRRSERFVRTAGPRAAVLQIFHSTNRSRVTPMWRRMPQARRHIEVANDVESPVPGHHAHAVPAPGLLVRRFFEIPRRRGMPVDPARVRRERWWKMDHDETWHAGGWKTHPRAGTVPISGTVAPTEQYKFLEMSQLDWRRGWDSFPWFPLRATT